MTKNDKCQIHVDTSSVRFPVAEDLYGLFFEEINRSGDGGLYAELLRNRSFEDSLAPKDCCLKHKGTVLHTHTGWKDQFCCGEGLKRWLRPYRPSVIPAWYGMNTSLSLNKDDVLNENREAALELSFEENGLVWNEGFNGIPLEAQKTYHLYFFAKAITQDACLELFAGSESTEPLTDVQTVHISCENTYQKIDCLLTASKSHTNARLFIKARGASHIRIGFISLMPQKTWCGHGFREDLVEMLKELHPSFLRFPGGCAVEGISKESAYRFADTLGPVWERKTKQIPWHYRTTNGIGFHEFLLLCEDLQVSAMYVINCGITCQARNPALFDDEEVEEWIRQACCAIDYATGDPTCNEWAKKRALAGHPKPFDLKYVEIGNENNHEPYFERYPRFYAVLKKKYPNIRFIANTHTQDRGMPTEIVDEHYYNNTTFFAKGVDFSTEKAGAPDIFIGEYAVTCGADIANLNAALAESAFLLHLENQQDRVKLTSYAPLFSRVDYKSWHPNLIEFDNHRVFGTPAYYALSMLSSARGQDVYTIKTSCPSICEKRIGRPGLLTNAQHLSLKNVTLNKKKVHPFQVLSGALSETEEGMETVLGSPSYMSHFPGFAHDLDDYTFAVFGDKDCEKIIYEGDIRIDSPHDEVALTVNNFHSPQLAQIDETMEPGTAWAPDAVDFCSWTLQDGQSRVSSSHWFFDTPLAKKKDLPIPYGTYFHFAIETRSDGFDCFLNKELIHQAFYDPFPSLVTTASGDASQIIVKAVNLADEDACAILTLNADVEKEFEITLLGGTSGKETNSIESPLLIVPATHFMKFDEEISVTFPKNSLSILTFQVKH